MVIHSAAAYKDPNRLGRRMPSTNVIGSIHVAKAAAEGVGVKQNNQFPDCPLLWQTRTGLRSPSDHPERPFTSYGISKTAGERYLLNSGLPVTSLRLANVTGPALGDRTYPYLLSKTKGGEILFLQRYPEGFSRYGGFPFHHRSQS